jgi:hypothetical protein
MSVMRSCEGCELRLMAFSIVLVVIVGVPQAVV